MSPQLKRSNPLHRSIRIALKQTDQLDNVFGKIGSVKEPDGRIHRAYRQAQRAMKGVLVDEPDIVLIPQVKSVFDDLREDLKIAGTDLMSETLEFTEANLRDMLGAYDTSVDDLAFPQPAQLLEAGVGVMISEVTRREALAYGYLVGEIEPELIVGDARHDGLFSPVVTARDSRRWLAELSFAASVGFIEFLAGFNRVPPDITKAVVAALDLRTTETCMGAHGQEQAFNEPFYLEYEPRFADFMQGPPFHDACRSVIVLIYPKYDDGVLDEMRAEGALALAKRR